MTINCLNVFNVLIESRVFTAHLIEQSHVSAAVVVTPGVVRQTLTDPEQSSISQVDDAQHHAGDGEDASNDVHEHTKAHLRSKVQSIQREEKLQFILFPESRGLI